MQNQAKLIVGVYKISKETFILNQTKLKKMLMKREKQYPAMLSLSLYG